MFKEESPNISSSNLFDLRNVRSKRLKILISALIATYTYKRLLTRLQKSIFFVDEAWLFIELSSVATLFENIARMGRKYGATFMYISQRLKSLLEHIKAGPS